MVMEEDKAAVILSCIQVCRIKEKSIIIYKTDAAAEYKETRDVCTIISYKTPTRKSVLTKLRSF